MFEEFGADAKPMRSQMRGMKILSPKVILNK